MIKTKTLSGTLQYDINDYICDTPEDLPNLPEQCAMGSTVFVISTATKYMKNSEQKWIIISKGGSASGGSTNPPSSNDDIIYEGGVI